MVAMRLLAAGILAAGTAAMPGCIVQEISDDLKKTTELLDVRLAMLETTNERLTQITVDMAKTNQTLADVKAELATTNTTMASVQKRLEVLDSINKSLDSLDDSLKTVKNLIEKIPFVGASDEEEKKPEEPKPAEGGKPVAPDK